MPSTISGAIILRWPVHFQRIIRGHASHRYGRRRQTGWPEFAAVAAAEDATAFRGMDSVDLIFPAFPFPVRTPAPPNLSYPKSSLTTTPTPSRCVGPKPQRQKRAALENK